MGGGIWGGWVISNFEKVNILFPFLALSIYKFSVVAQKPFFHFDHSIVAPLPKPTKQVVKMNELEAKKFAADSVRHMLGGAPGTKVAWGEGLAVFWGTTVPVDRLAITGQLLTAIGFKEEAIALDHIMEWANMCSLSTIKKSNFKMPIKRKGFYIAIIEVVFIINGQDVADVEGEQDGEASVVVVWRRSRCFTGGSRRCRGTRSPCRGGRR